MSPTASSPKFSELLRDWLIGLGIILISFFSIVLSLICIYALPDKTSRPLTGAMFYIIGAMVVASSLFLWRRKETEAAFSIENRGSKEILVKKPVSKKILEWTVGVYLFYFVINGIILALICIYALPDTTTQPEAGLLYFASGGALLGSFVLVVWKSLPSEKEKP